jgi:hypothetical protein
VMAMDDFEQNFASKHRGSGRLCAIYKAAADQRSEIRAVVAANIAQFCKENDRGGKGSDGGIRVTLDEAQRTMLACELLCSLSHLDMEVLTVCEFSSSLVWHWYQA